MEDSPTACLESDHSIWGGAGVLRAILAREQERSLYLQRSEVDHAIDRGGALQIVLSKDIVKGLLIGDVGTVKFRSLPTDELDSIEHHLGGIIQIVDNDNLVPCLEQGQGSK